MVREDSGYELKEAFNHEEPGAMIELVKDLVALANSGGGVVCIGVTEISQPGISKEVVPHLDGALIGDQIDRYIAPARVAVSHRVMQLNGDRVIVELHIESSGRYPLVFSKQGQYRVGKRNICVFRPGDIYVRRGARSERITHSDLAKLIDRAVAQASAETQENTIRTLESLLREVARIPAGTAPIVLAQKESGDLVGTPGAVIDFAIQRRKSGHRGFLLDRRDLLISFLNRNEFEHTRERLDLLIRSALRRSATLYFWLSEVADRDLVKEILLDTLHDEDRDKSDAKDNLLEVASLFVDDEAIDEIVTTMNRSRYKHFKDSARRWPGREAVCNSFENRVSSVQIDGTPAVQLPVMELLKHAEVTAAELLHSGKSQAKARLMAEIGRVVFKLRSEGS